MNKNKKEFVADFLKALAYTAKDIGYAFTMDFYLHRGRKYNLYYPDDHERFKKGLHNLKRQGYIQVRNKSFKFTKKGKEWYKRKVYKQTPFRESEWDGKWRVVFFDIPEEMHRQRDMFRYRLKNLGFYQLQKSILAIPFKCESDIAEICSRLKISQYVDILVADSIGAKEQEIKKIFNL